MHSSNPSVLRFSSFCLYRADSGKKDSKKFVKGIYLPLSTFLSLKLPRFSGEIQTRPRALGQGVFLKKHLTFFVNCGLIFLHGGGGFDLSLESATAPVRSGLTL